MGEAAYYYSFFLPIQEIIRAAALALARMGVQYSTSWFFACAVLFVLTLGALMALGEDVRGIFRRHWFKIFLVMFLTISNFYLEYVLPTFVDDMPRTILGAITGASGDIGRQSAAMEGLIDTIVAKIVKSTGWVEYLALAPFIYGAAAACKVFIGCMFLVVFFFQNALYFVGAFAAWLLIFLAFESTRSFAMDCAGLTVSLLCALLGVEVVFTALAMGLNTYGNTMVVAISTVSIPEALAGLASFVGLFFMCAVMMVASGWIAMRIGGGGAAVGAAAGGMAMAAGKLFAASKNMNAAADKMVKAVRARTNAA